MIHFYIKHFLETNQLVIVPGLGAFTLEEIPAWYQEENQQFHPAVKKIAFAESRRFEESSFLADVARLSAYSEPEVQAKIQEFIYDLRHDITENGYFQIQGLGKLKIDSAYNLIFEQDDSSQAESYGLPDLDIPIIEREEGESFITPTLELSLEKEEDKEAAKEEFSLENESLKSELVSENTEELNEEDINNANPEEVIEEQEERIDAAEDELADDAHTSKEVHEGEGEIVAEEIGRNDGPGFEVSALPAEKQDIEKAENELLSSSIPSTEVAEKPLTPPVSEQKMEEEEKSLSTPAIILFILIPICVGLSVYYYLNFYNQPAVKQTQNTVADIPPIAPGTPESVDTESAATEIEMEEATKPETKKSTDVNAEPKVEPSMPKESDKVIPKEAEKAKEVIAKAPVKEEKIAKVEEKPQTSEVSAAEGRFKIIAGGFSSKENAEKLVKQLNAKGYSPTVLEPNAKTRLWQVALASFNSQAEAKAFLSKEQKNFKESLWIKK